ncbi:hypothetical protein [Bradyrhizobium sp. ORS 375]|uniref:hypothetical protein n=1 Tax=Bradyrhizobium sp. (strain ORS 375) TaxID=566679 RepID=UPI00054DB300|nr:hypothetical protein [Bradyrhizobium sp. ORS 375]
MSDSLIVVAQAFAQSAAHYAAVTAAQLDSYAYIPLKYTACPLLALGAVRIALYFESKVRFAFTLFVLASFVCMIRNVVPESATVFGLQIQLSQISNWLLPAFTFFLLVPIDMNDTGLKLIERLGNIALSATVFTGLFVVAKQSDIMAAPIEDTKAADAWQSMAAAIAASIGLVAFVMRYGTVRAVAMAIFAICWTAPQKTYWLSIHEVEDIMRLGVLGMGFILLTLPKPREDVSELPSMTSSPPLKRQSKMASI